MPVSRCGPVLCPVVSVSRKLFSGSHTESLCWLQSTTKDSLNGAFVTDPGRVVEWKQQSDITDHLEGNNLIG